MNNSNDMMFEYLLQMGAMQPEQQQMLRKQAMVDALRKQAMTPIEGQMVGRHYVAPHLGQYLAQLGTGYLAGQGQKAQDAAMLDMNQRQRQALERMRQQRMMGQQPMPQNMMQADPYQALRYPDEA